MGLFKRGVGVGAGLVVFGMSGLAVERPVDFRFEVLPILSDRCIACHGPDKAAAKAKLQLHTFKTATAERKDGPVLVPGDLEKSHIWQRIIDEEDPMPPLDSDRKPLTAKEKDIMKRWIEQGGVYEEHWAFVPPQKPEVPSAEKPASALKRFGRSLFGKRKKSAESADRTQWQTNPIDRFVLRKLNASEVEPAPEADRATLARRASLALIGLPPEPQWVADFVADARPDAYDRYVDLLLDQPTFGEHQARYWLDAVRYGDTHGLHLDNRRGIFPYRDWVIRAYNQNLPYDEFIRWQIAGDMMPDATLQQQTASGYVRMNMSTGEGGAIAKEFHAKNSFDRTENFGTVFLGMTFNCARCHTHKYDPIQHEEYYSLLAFFNNTAESPLDGNKEKYGNVAYVPKDQPTWTAWERLEKELDATLTAVSIDDAELVKFAKSGKAPKAKKGAPRNWETLSQVGSWKKLNRNMRMAVLADPASPAAAGLKGLKLDGLLKQRAEMQKQFTTTLIAAEKPQLTKTFVLERGEYDKPKVEVSRGTPKIMGAYPDGAPKDRRGLAEWLVGEQNPLVTRVLLNRIWQRTFGEGLVRTPEDFGLQGQAPTHPELLDWLCVDFMESGWNVKRLLKMMVTSQAFRQQSVERPELEDSPNLKLARGPRFRLDAEVLRDQALWASGKLKPLSGGEGIKPYQPGGMWLAMAHPGSNTKKYQHDKGPRMNHRSLYVYWKRTSPHPMMTLFDAPDRESSCVRRSRTSTPLQSLALFNETQRLELARSFAARLIRESDTDAERLDAAFQLLASRVPSASERKTCMTLLEGMRKRFIETPDDAKALLSVGEAPKTSGIPVIEHAAWSQLAVTLLASDMSLLLY